MTEAVEGLEPYDDDLIPDIETSDWPDMVGYVKSKVSLRDGYIAFVPKANGIGRPVSGGKETFIRCPSPSHIDKKPSAWMQEGEGLWFCSVCQVGGDLFDLAAFATGWPVPGYKSDSASFTDVVNEVCERMGATEADARFAGYVTETRPLEAADVSPEWPEDFTEVEMAEAYALFESWDESGVPGAKDLAVRDVLARRKLGQRDTELADERNDHGLEPGLSRELDIAIAEMLEVDTYELADSYDDAVQKGLLVEVGCDPTFAHIPWQDVIPPDTPIYRMLKATCVNDIPDEYFIWAIYTALGSMIGRRIELANNRGAVDPALWTVIIGATGSSKSTVAVEMDRILAKVAPVQDSDGVKIIGVPASGERFLEMIRRDSLVGIGATVELDECKNAASFMYSDEFSLLGSLLSRAGSTLTSLLLQAYGLRRDYVLRPTESMSRVSFPVTGPMLSILSTTQPNRISDMLSKFDVASGFMNRFIFGMGVPRRVCVPMMGFGPDYSVVEAEFKLIQSRLNCSGQFDHLYDKAHVDKPWQLGPDAGGLSRMRRWMHDQAQKAKQHDDYTADLLARRELVMLKITLIMAINRICGGDDWKHWTEGDVEAAIAHYPNIEHGWLETGGRVLDSEDTRLEDWILTKVEQTGATGISRRDLGRSIPKSMRKNAKGFNEIINSMNTNGSIREVDLKNGKSKKSTKWIYSVSVEVSELSVDPEPVR